MMFRAWEIRKIDDEKSLPNRKIVPEIYFRHIEKIMLYLIKYGIQWIVLMVVKNYLIIVTKTKKWAGRNWPKVYDFFIKKTEDTNKKKHSFFHKAIIESKTKIKNVREKVRKEHGEK